jgi:glycosyltransferase involved in cell wall biosynthesis
MSGRTIAGRAPSAGPRTPVSVLIAARDEETLLPEALASVVEWADEVVVVVDPRTHDRTREFAAERGARVFEHRFDGSANQLSWGLAQCRHDWVFILDADERVAGELRDRVDSALIRPRHPAYAVLRRNVAFGRALRFGDWGGDRVVRLVDRRRVLLEGGMHWRVLASTTGRLRGTLTHHTLRSLDQYLPKLLDYARRGAVETAGRRVAGVTIGGRPLWRFVRAYVVRLGFLDGVPGLIVAGLSAVGTLLKWALVWERGVTTDPQRPYTRA